MITKFKQIKNLSVFQDFEWDNEVIDTNGKPLSFTVFNILYGRNYSGKTSLSRIVRVLETGLLPPRCPDLQFSIEFSNRNIASQDKRECDDFVRVYNEDFVRDNLQFLIDPTASVVPFAVLGEQNKTIEEEINELLHRLGNNEAGQESGYYKELQEAKKASNDALMEWHRRKRDLEDKLSAKATDREIGIKYNHTRFGEINYNISKLKEEIELVCQPIYIVPDKNKLEQWEAALDESPKNPVEMEDFLELGYETYISTAAELLARKVGVSERITELSASLMLENWVRSGMELHKERHSCAFCGSSLTSERMKELSSHFSKETQMLRNEIEQLKNTIEKELTGVETLFNTDLTLYYTPFHERVSLIETKTQQLCAQYAESLKAVIKQLDNRLACITEPITFVYPKNVSEAMKDAYNQLLSIVKENNTHTKSLETQKKNAQRGLRLYEIFSFIKTIGYKEIQQEIQEYETKKARYKADEIEAELKVNNILKEIDDKKTQLSDESKGAEIVNTYLSTYFGHHSLKLEAIKSSENTNITRFRIMRGNEIAYNLSQGECSLISFVSVKPTHVFLLSYNYARMFHHLGMP